MNARKTGRWTILILLLCGAPRAWAGHTAPPASDPVANLIQGRETAELFTSAVVGVVSGPSSAAASTTVTAYGSANADSLFEVGSLTKSFTGVLLARLVNEGKVSPEDPVSRFLPELAGKFAGDITLAELATHTSGLDSVPDDLPETLDPYATYSWPSLLAALARATPPAGQTRPYPAEYSNLGFALLGNILAQVAGLSYSELLADQITTPLAMSSTTTTVSSADLPRFLDPYGTDLSIVPHWNWSAFEPAGAIRSSGNDLVRYVRAGLFPDQSALGRAIALSESKNWGWDSALDGFDFPYKNGATGGFRSALLIDPAKNVGTIVLTNIAYEADTLALAAVNPAIHDEADFAIAPEALAAFAGIYSSSENPADQIVIEIPGQFLIADFRRFSELPAEGRARLRATSGASFEIIDNFGELLEASGKIVFEQDGSGKVAGMSFQVTTAQGVETSNFIKNAPSRNIP